MKTLKVSVCLIFMLLGCLMFLFHGSRVGSGQERTQGGSIAGSTAPDIDRFDKAVQKRFLTMPAFGMARIVSSPTRPEPLRSKHVGSFHPQDEEETSVLSEFQKDGWEVGLYLFGRWAYPDEKRKDPLDKFKIDYRINRPLPITAGLKEKDLTKSKKLISEIKSAFLTFQLGDNPKTNRYQFSRGGWTYIAKPVRVANQSCLKCHTDYVITEQLDDGKFKFRKRSVGDVNGVIVYGFKRKE